jgi:hypothetical protein
MKSDSRRSLDDLTAKEVRELWKRLTPEQRTLIEDKINEVIPQFRRSLFKVVQGGRQKSK